ncbi:MAG: universal stress protein [Betaproteobacteria bacterium]|nr:universal stress protein [Betaproteobacteria bacterium]
MREPWMPSPGEEFEGFRIIERAHEGGMAVLFRVEKPGLEVAMLMKVPRLGFGSHPAGLAGFDTESMILPRLGGAHVPRCIARSPDVDRPYLVIERIAGASLADAAARAPLAEVEVAALGSALAAAAHALHLQEVVHLDLKPSHVRLRADGCAVLVDFGLARHGRLPDLIGEEFRRPMGTGAYISPEQLRGERGDPRSDVFAIGVMLYLLATGALPFGSPQGLLGMKRRLFIDPLPPVVAAPGVPGWLQEIVLHCLEVDASNRYASAGLLAHDLEYHGELPLGERACRRARRGPGATLRRWLKARGKAPENPARPGARVNDAAHVLVALDPAGSSPRLLEALAHAVRQSALLNASARVTCVSVLEPSAGLDDERGEIADGEHVQQLIETRHWAAALALPAERLRCQVIVASDAAGALVDYARKHHADQIVIGARASSTLRRFLGSVSSRVVAEAPCSVNVVRTPGEAAEKQ